MNQADKIVDVLSEIVPTIYYDVFKDDFGVFMAGLWEKPDEKIPPILDRKVIPTGETIKTLEQTDWNALSGNKKMEWLKRMDLQALLKALFYRPESLDLFCEKNSLIKRKMQSVLQRMINWRNYGVGHKSVYKYEQMGEEDFKQKILEPVWEFTDLLSRHYAKECEIIRNILHQIEIRMKLPDTSVQKLVELSGKPESTVKEVLLILKVDIAQDGKIIGEDEKELADNIKRLSKKESVQQKQKENEPEDKTNRWLELFNKYKKIIIPVAGVIVLLIIILLLTQCGKKDDKKSKANKKQDKVTVEETTTDNRETYNPFKNMVIEEIESEEDSSDYGNEEEQEQERDPNSKPVDLKITSRDSKYPNLHYDVMEVYADEDEFLVDKERWDSDIREAGEESEQATDEYGETIDYSKELTKGEIVIIQLSATSVDAHKDIKFVNDEGKTYYKYTVHGHDIIKTEESLGLVSKKTLKKAIKSGKNQIKKLDADFSNESMSNIKAIGHYVTLPNNNPEEDSYIFIIYQMNISSDEYASLDSGTYYCCSALENPEYNYKGNKKIYSNDNNEITYGELKSSWYTLNILDHIFYKSVKKVYEEFISESVSNGNDPYKFPYKKNSKIKIY